MAVGRHLHGEPGLDQLAEGQRHVHPAPDHEPCGRQPQDHLAEHDEVSGRPLVNGATVYNIALPRTGMEVERPILDYHAYREETGPIEVKCNLHPDEKAHLLVFGHPYAALTGERGEFTIENVPAGRHDVWVWYGGIARKMRTVEFSGAGSVEEILEIAEEDLAVEDVK